MRLATFNIKNGLCADGTCDPDVLARACCALRAIHTDVSDHRALVVEVA